VRIGEGGIIAVSRGKQLSNELYKLQRKVAPYGFILPGTAFYLMVTIMPMFMGLWMSLHRWNILRTRQTFIGLANYATVLTNPVFWQALKNTLIYTVGVVPVQIGLALIVALLLNAEIRGRTMFRLLYYLPVVTPLSIAAVIWQWIYHPQMGLLNAALSTFGVAPRNWLGDPQIAMLSVIIVAIWAGLGYKMVIFLAALQGIPESYYEAAMIDGANRLDLFRHITLPLLRPTMLYVFITSLIGSFQVFGLVNVLTGGGPLDATNVLVMHIYRRAFSDYQFGEASAMSFVLFAIILLFTLVQWKVMGREVSYD
jgi:ABC-type sugar transport system permease subunit